MKKIKRVKYGFWRYDEPRFDKKKGSFKGDSYPDPNNLRNKPKGGDTGFKSSKVHYELIWKNNPYPNNQEIARLAGGLWNRAYNRHLEGLVKRYKPHMIPDKTYTYLPEKYSKMLEKGDPPRADGVLFGGAIIEVLEEKNDWSRINCMSSKNIDPSSNPLNDPFSWQKVSSVHRNRVNVGNAPRGYAVFIPIVAKDGQAWIESWKLEDVDKHDGHPEYMINLNNGKENGENMTENHDGMFFVDISRWQSNYTDDGIDEGWPLQGVIQKVADGLADYSKEGSYYYNLYWKSQNDSIKHFRNFGAYHWYQTEQSPIAQADLSLSVLERLDYLDVYIIDFESYYNQINSTSIQQLKQYVEHFKQNTDKRLWIYTNWTLYTQIRSVLGQQWVDQQEWFMAGGNLYNTEITQLPPDSFFDGLFAIPGRVAVQWSADGNRLADELDFGESENASIDYDYIYMDQEAWDIYTGSVVEEPIPDPDPPTEPPCDCSDEMDDAFQEGQSVLSEFVVEELENLISDLKQI